MLDIRTIFVMLVLFCLVAGIGVLGLRLPDERRASVRRWAAGNFLAGAGLLLLALRNLIPLWPSVVLGNGLLLCGLLFFYQSICLLVKKPFKMQRHLLACVAVIAIFHLLLTLGITPRYRIVTVAAVVAVVFASIALALRHLQSPAINRPRLLMVGLYIAAALGALLQGLYAAFLADSTTTVFEPAAAQLLGFITLALALMGSSVAYMLMQSGLAYHDLAVVVDNDMLAGVRNRHHFLAMAEHDWALAQRQGRPLSVMKINLDHFPGINDEFGQLTGDEALRRFGGVLRRAVRHVDLVCRYSGEEFCIVMADTEPEVARRSAERIRQELATLEMRVSGRRVPLSVSIGIAGLNSMDDRRSLSQLIMAADQALCLAKTAGCNRVEMEKP